MMPCRYVLCNGVLHSAMACYGGELDVAIVRGIADVHAVLSWCIVACCMV